MSIDASIAAMAAGPWLSRPQAGQLAARRMIPIGAVAEGFCPAAGDPGGIRIWGIAKY
jgi:hypothetical protein